MKYWHVFHGVSLVPILISLLKTWTCVLEIHGDRDALPDDLMTLLSHMSHGSRCFCLSSDGLRKSNGITSLGAK